MNKLTIELDDGDGQDYTFLGWKEDGLAFYATSPKGRPVMVEPVSAYPDNRYTGEPYRFPRCIPHAISPKRVRAGLKITRFYRFENRLLLPPFHSNRLLASSSKVRNPGLSWANARVLPSALGP